MMFQAYDSKTFPTADECLAYEKTIPEWALVGLTIDQVREAIARRDVPRADAIELIGTRIGRTRREVDGEFRHPAKAAPAPPTLAITGPAPEPTPKMDPRCIISTEESRINPDDDAEAA